MPSLFGDDVREAGIFLDACRINHACDNNAQKSWNENIKRHTIHALRDIEKDEEITIPTSESPRIARPVKRLFKENLRLPARVLFALYHQIRVRRAVEG
jgi:SET domain-containing protein